MGGWRAPCRFPSIFSHYMRALFVFCSIYLELVTFVISCIGARGYCIIFYRLVQSLQPDTHIAKQKFYNISWKSSWQGPGWVEITRKICLCINFRNKGWKRTTWSWNFLEKNKPHHPDICRKHHLLQAGHFIGRVQNRHSKMFTCAGECQIFSRKILYCNSGVWA